MIWGESRATRKLCPTFFTGFGFLTIWANLKQNDRCAECLDESFEQQASCARCFPQVSATGQLRTVFFGQVLAFQRKAPILINRTVAHAVSTGFSLLTLRPKLKENDSCAVWLGSNFDQQQTSFSFLRNVTHFKQNDSCAVWFGANFLHQESCARRFSQDLAS